MPVLHRELRTVRRLYAVNRKGTERGIAAVAVAVCNVAGTPVAALSVSVPTVRYSSSRIPELLSALRKRQREFAKA